MSALKDLRDYGADDGEEYWIVTLARAVETIQNELQSWPEARTLNPSTGEIKQGPLCHLVDTIAEGISAGHAITVEPAAASSRGDT